LEREDSSAAQVEDAKFGTSQGFIIDPTVDGRSGGDSGKALTEPRKNDAGQLAKWIRSNARGQRI
jgi:hypothetical protein